MATKYYAVRQGRETGIFWSWADCQRQVTGFKGAEFKSFLTLEDAKAYLAGEVSARMPAKKNSDGLVELFETQPDVLAAFVDGGYHVGTGEFSYGMVLISGNPPREVAVDCEKYTDPELASMRNVAGEIKGAEKAIAFCLEQGIKSVAIYHDYEGIARWCTGEWQAKKFGTQQYRDFYHQAVGQGLQVEFIKVKGHSGNRYNDVVDALAKSALGIGVTDK